MLKNNEKTHIDRMKHGESLLRIGAIWFGNDSKSTVTHIYYFGNKQIETLLPIRAESALSFSSSKPPLDTLQAEIIVNYDAFQTHVQRLMASVQISPVLPVLNPVIAAITQPVIHNKQVYAAYGFSTINDDDVINGTNNSKLMDMYASTPVQMRIDTISIETITGSPRDIRIILKLTRVLTANIYGDRVTYVRTMEDAIKQHAYISKITSETGDNAQEDAIAAMCGIDVSGMRAMIDEMRSPLRDTNEIGVTFRGVITDIIAPDMYAIRRADGTSLIGMPYGVECLNGFEKLQAFGLESHAFSAGLSRSVGSAITKAKHYLTTALRTSHSSTNNSVNLMVIEKGPITMLDGLVHVNNQTGYEIYYCIITHPTLFDIGNTLLSHGHAFESPCYAPEKVPPEYDRARRKAKNMARKQSTEKTRDNSALLVQQDSTLLPWTMRKTLRRLVGKKDNVNNT